MPLPPVVVHVIGLFLVSYQILPGGGLGAEAPRIPCPPPHANSDSPQKNTLMRAGLPPANNITITDVSAQAAMASKGVPEHRASLLIPRKNCVPVQACGNGAGLYNGLYTVPLDGDRIRFIPSPVVTTSSGVQRAAFPSRTQ